jgi:hypothetical protein
VIGGELCTFSEGYAQQATRFDILKDASIVDPDNPRDFTSRYHTTRGKGFLKTGFGEGVENAHGFSP